MADTDPQRYVDKDGHLFETWYSTADTEIGGWIVTNSPKPHEEQDYQQGELVLANFLSEELACHIADIHNQWIDRCHYELNYHVSPHRGCFLR